ncbi:MAG TPA: A/G-specific adenine glycosylase [Chthoniobacterales bacterium]|nr:A/G-specific adenine glycosylase [Chthoniobacterales bacterium]
MTNRKAFRRALLGWHRQHGRDLPWRQTRDPYAILVSEFMLQQTQVATVLPYYKDWLQRFPNFAVLARASEADVLHAWQGLGYYARARNLHSTAKRVVDRHRGQFPKSIEQMEQLPGVGKYTAHAVATFAFDQSVPIVEANTSRVLSRLFDLRVPVDSTAGRNALWDYAASLAPKKSPSAYNSALLDLGALVCLPRKPKCGICPVKKFCRAKHPESLPIKRPRPETKQLVEKHSFVASRDKLLLVQSANRWRGMWILPPTRSTSTRPIHSSHFPFTNHRITLQIFRQRERQIDNPRKRWFPFGKLDSIPIPSPHRRAIDALLN